MTLEINHESTLIKKMKKVNPENDSLIQGKRPGSGSSSKLSTKITSNSCYRKTTVTKNNPNIQVQKHMCHLSNDAKTIRLGRRLNQRHTA